MGNLAALNGEAYRKLRIRAKLNSQIGCDYFEAHRSEPIPHYRNGESCQVKYISVINGL